LDLTVCVWRPVADRTNAVMNLMVHNDVERRVNTAVLVYNLEKWSTFREVPPDYCVFKIPSPLRLESLQIHFLPSQQLVQNPNTVQ